VIAAHAYSKNAEVTVPSLDDWQKEREKNPHGIVPPKVVPVDFRAPLLLPGNVAEELVLKLVTLIHSCRAFGSETEIEKFLARALSRVAMVSISVSANPSIWKGMS